MVKTTKSQDRKEEKSERDNRKVGGKKSKEKETQRENGKKGEIVPDLDLRGSGPSDVSIS